MSHPPETAFVFFGFASLASLFSDEDWQRMIGPWGGLFISLAICLILLRHSAKRIKRDDLRADKKDEDDERRHQERLAAQKESDKKFTGLTERVMAMQAESVLAMLKVADSNNLLANEIQKRPCQQQKQNDE